MGSSAVAEKAEEAIAEADALVADVKAPTGIAGSAERLYRWSAWVHVGPGAQDCEDVDDAKNECGDRTHFHAWCRLPNPLQEEEIREKALAEKARRTRMLRDPDTDACAMIDGQIDTVRDQGEESVAPQIVEELLGRRQMVWYFEAVQELGEELDEEVELEDEDDERPRKWGHVGSDQQRAIELHSLDPAERDEDELKTLMKHLEEYEAALKARQEEKARPMREELEGLEFEELLERLRRARVDRDTRERFSAVYNRELWLRCTLKVPSTFGRPSVRVFASPLEIEEAPPEVVLALTDTFNDLEQSRNAVSQGNS